MNIKESIINGMLVLSAIYIFACAFINLLGDIDHLNLVTVIGMMVVSLFDVLLLILNYSKNYKKMLSSKKKCYFYVYLTNNHVERYTDSVDNMRKGQEAENLQKQKKFREAVIC